MEVEASRAAIEGEDEEEEEEEEEVFWTTDWWCRGRKYFYSFYTSARTPCVVVNGHRVPPSRMFPLAV